MEYEKMEYDILIVGAGPAGLTAAIRLQQLALLHHKNMRVCILEKGAQIGAHILSGAVFEPQVLKTLLPNDWQDAPLDTPVRFDKFFYLTPNHAYRLPTPSLMKNKGNYIISLGELCRFLARYAENLGCEIYPGFAATQLLYNDEGAVIGVKTGDMGIDKKGNKTTHYQPGIHLYAKQTLFAEGCHGELSNVLIDRFQLRRHAQPQTYGLGIKEVWQIPASQHSEGLVTHSVGWPLDHKTYGGSFCYHFSQNRVAIGFVVGLDYQNPWLDPFEELQRFKTHPLISKQLVGAERIAYGARALNEGGWQSLPKLTFPGGLLIGDAAGFLNVPKIKGIHTAMQSALIAAETCFSVLAEKESMVPLELTQYSHQLKQSWLAKELYKVRNIRPGFRYGLVAGMANAAFEMYISRGKSPWTLSNPSDHLSLKLARLAKKIEYPKPDGILTFDKLSSIYLSNTFHAEDQPCHIELADPKRAITINYQRYASPETRYCPAAVYEIIGEQTTPYLHINAQNCIHCKTCDIKDPAKNIIWHAPEGGGGPNYTMM